MTGTGVVVIGGAAMGASLAFWLTRMEPGLSVTVIEPDPSYARSCTALSAASIRQQFSEPVNVAISRFGVEFIRDFARWTGPAGGVPSLGFRENGYLFLADSAAEAERFEALAAMQRSLGAATAVLTPAEIAARFPWIDVAGLHAGSFGPRDEGWFDNMGLVTGLKAAARAQGARFLRGRVVGLDRDGGRIAAARLEDGSRIGADRFACAAGTAAGAVLRMAGADLPVEPRKRTVFVVDAPKVRQPDAPLIVDPAGYWMRPEHGQWLTATVPDHDGPCDPQDFEPEAGEFEALIWERIWARIPDFDQARVTRVWAGHYDFNPVDHNGLVGRHPELDNMFLLNGFSGHGLQQAPAVGRGVAELMLTGGYVSIDLSDLSAARLTSGAWSREQAIV